MRRLWGKHSCRVTNEVCKVDIREALMGGSELMTAPLVC